MVLWQSMILLFQLLISFWTVSNTGADCQSPWIAHGSSCYMFVQTKTNWFHAAHKCRIMDATLVQIDSADEETFIKQTITGLHANDDPQTIGYWTDANDIEVENEWVWGYPGGLILTYSDWFPGEPNNAWYDHRPEDCVVLWGHSHHMYQWNDQPCDNLDFFICETQGDDSHCKEWSLWTADWLKRCLHYWCRCIYYNGMVWEDTSRPVPKIPKIQRLSELSNR